MGKNDFVLELVDFGWKNKGQTNIDTEFVEGLEKGGPEKVVLCLVRLGLD